MIFVHMKVMMDDDTAAAAAAAAAVDAAGPPAELLPLGGRIPVTPQQPV